MQKTSKYYLLLQLYILLWGILSHQSNLSLLLLSFDNYFTFSYFYVKKFQLQPFIIRLQLKLFVVCTLFDLIYDS